MRNSMLRIVAGTALAAAVAVPALGFGSQAFADPTPNDHNCVGVRITSLTPPGAGPIVKGIADNGPGSVADLVHSTQELCED